MLRSFLRLGRTVRTVISLWGLMMAIGGCLLFFVGNSTRNTSYVVQFAELVSFHGGILDGWSDVPVGFNRGTSTWLVNAQNVRLPRGSGELFVYCGDSAAIAANAFVKAPSVGLSGDCHAFEPAADVEPWSIILIGNDLGGPFQGLPGANAATVATQSSVWLQGFLVFLLFHSLWLLGTAGAVFLAIGYVVQSKGYSTNFADAFGMLVFVVIAWLATPAGVLEQPTYFHMFLIVVSGLSMGVLWLLIYAPLHPLIRFRLTDGRNIDDPNPDGETGSLCISTVVVIFVLLAPAAMGCMINAFLGIAMRWMLGAGIQLASSGFWFELYKLITGMTP